MTNDSEENVNIAIETLAESERYTVWRAKEPDGEIQYHIDIENLTVHFFEEEWQELLDVLGTLIAENGTKALPKKRK